MKRRAYFVFLDEIPAELISKVGGKAGNLVVLKRLGVEIPNGFIITTDYFSHSFRHFGISKLIQKYEENHSIDDAGIELFDLVSAQLSGSQLFKAMIKDLKKPYERLVNESGLIISPLVAVRSSAPVEDSDIASFAGQFVTTLGVSGLKELTQAVIKSWSSAFSKRVLSYIKQKKINISADKLQMAVLVQLMIPSEKSGVIFTKNPNTPVENEMVIEGSYGLGELLVSGRITPDTYIINLQNCAVLQRKLGSKKMYQTLINGKIETIATPNEKRAVYCLTDYQISSLCLESKKIASHFGKPQDIEWAIYKESIFFLQSRPLT